MDPATHLRLLLKIVIGSAWVDQALDEPEWIYLQKLLHRYHLAQDPELKELMKTPIPLAQTERWMLEYLVGSTESERLRLLGAIGNLMIADQEVSEIEHVVLDEYYTLMATIPSVPESFPSLIRGVGGLVKKLAQAVGIGSGGR